MASYPTYDPSVFVDAQARSRSTASTRAPTRPPLEPGDRRALPVGLHLQADHRRGGARGRLLTPGELLDSPSEIDALQAASSRTSRTSPTAWSPADAPSRCRATPTSTKLADRFYRRRGESGLPLQAEAARLRAGPGHGDRPPGEEPGLVPDPPWKQRNFAGPALHRLRPRLASRRHDPARRGPGLPAGDPAADGRGLRGDRRRRHRAHAHRWRAACSDPNGRVVQELSQGRPDPPARRSRRQPGGDPAGPLPGRQRPRRHLHRRVRRACPTDDKVAGQDRHRRAVATAARTTPGSWATRPSTTPRSSSRSSSSAAARAPTPPRRPCAARWARTWSSTRPAAAQPTDGEPMTTTFAPGRSAPLRLLRPRAIGRRRPRLDPAVRASRPSAPSACSWSARPTENDIPGDPRFYLDRQILFIAIGRRADGRGHPPQPRPAGALGVGAVGRPARRAGRGVRGGHRRQGIEPLDRHRPVQPPALGDGQGRACDRAGGHRHRARSRTSGSAALHALPRRGRRDPGGRRLPAARPRHRRWSTRPCCGDPVPGGRALVALRRGRVDPGDRDPRRALDPARTRA